VTGLSADPRVPQLLHEWVTHLRRWISGQACPLGIARDARAYAAWQEALAARMGVAVCRARNGRTFLSMGNDWDPSAVPVPDTVDHAWCGQRSRTPKGASHLGVMDLVGNVWQWTEEFLDDHTRAAIVRGGSYYQPQGSMWYFPQPTSLLNT